MLVTKNSNKEKDILYIVRCSIQSKITQAIQVLIFYIGYDKSLEKYNN